MDRPSRYETWPFEIRELFDRIVRLESEDSEAALEAYEHLSELMKQREDETTALAAADAILALNARYTIACRNSFSAAVRSSGVGILRPRRNSRQRSGAIRIWETQGRRDHGSKRRSRDKLVAKVRTESGANIRTCHV
jgi:hypothetical protein